MNIQKKIFIVANIDQFFLSHRKEIGIVANKTYDVTIVAKDTGKRKEIESLGLKFIDLPLDRTGMNPFIELKTLFFLYNLYRRKRPDLVHHVGLKPLLWGSLAAKMVGIRAEVNAVSGLGALFSKEGNKFVRSLVCKALQYSHKRRKLSVIFQNDDDKKVFLDNKIIKESCAEYIKGSGIDLEDYAYFKPQKDDRINIIFTGRMIAEKGVFTLLDAASLLKKKYSSSISFWLCGGIDNNPSAISRKELESKCDGSYTKWLGFRHDILELLKKSHIVAFPSYYREGLPKSLIEANAVGRPIITTNSTGCRDTVVDGYNGYIIPIKNSKLLAEKLEILINDDLLRYQMGLNARKYAEENFSVQEVVAKHLAIYEKLLK